MPLKRAVSSPSWGQQPASESFTFWGGKLIDLLAIRHYSRHWVIRTHPSSGLRWVAFRPVKVFMGEH